MLPEDRLEFQNATLNFKALIESGQERVETNTFFNG